MSMKPDEYEHRRGAAEHRQIGPRGGYASQTEPRPLARVWIDPLTLLSRESRSFVDGDEGMTTLFERLDALGPARLSVRREAARLSLRSESTFKRQFPKFAGCPWREFQRRWRVQTAMRLLPVPGASEKAIARICGFSSTSSLSHAFKATRGMSPREFVRRRVSGKSGGGFG